MDHHPSRIFGAKQPAIYSVTADPHLVNINPVDSRHYLPRLIEPIHTNHR